MMRSGCQSYVAGKWLSGRPAPASLLNEPAAVEVRSAGQDRGLGLFAVRRIPEFGQILVDSSLVTMRPDDDLPELYLLFNTLPDLDKESYLNLSHRDDAVRNAMLKDKLLARGFPQTELEQMAKVASIMQNNAFNVDLGDGLGKNYRALFPRIARINHSCAPNAHVCFLPPAGPSKKGAMVVHALKCIEPGEEVLISYFSILLPRSERQAKARKWGFECGCPVCTGRQEDEDLRTSLRDFTIQQAEFVRKTRVASKDASALLREGEALVVRVEGKPELYPTLPDLFDGMGTLRAKALGSGQGDGREAQLAAFEQSAIWEARITGHDSPATIRRLRQLERFTAKLHSRSSARVVGRHGDYSIQWSSG